MATGSGNLCAPALPVPSFVVSFATVLQLSLRFAAFVLHVVTGFSTQVKAGTTVKSSLFHSDCGGDNQSV